MLYNILNQAILKYKRGDKEMLICVSYLMKRLMVYSFVLPKDIKDMIDKEKQIMDNLPRYPLLSPIPKYSNLLIEIIQIYRDSKIESIIKP